MKSLFSVLKLQFWIGFIGTLLLSPVLYIVEILGGSIQRFGPFMWLDVIMILLAPFFIGLWFVLTAAVAFPVLRALQRRGLFKDI